MKPLLLILAIILNQGTNMKQYSISNEENVITLNIEQVAEYDLKFELMFEDKNITINKNGIAVNPDPEGMASLEEFDPSGDFNPMEMYIFSTDEYLIKILVPLVEVETDYVGLTIDNLDGENLFDGMLKIK